MCIASQHVACHTCIVWQLAVGGDVGVEGNAEGAGDEPRHADPPQEEGEDATEEHRREDLFQDRERKGDLKLGLSNGVDVRSEIIRNRRGGR